MPTTYAHDSFGREVYKRLPEEIQEAVGKNMRIYRVGLHGPDILFYTSPFISTHVNRMGHALHKAVARQFFLKGVQIVKDSGDASFRAYLLGFACHYVLDSTCHPVIKVLQKEIGESHSEIETQLDRYLMERDGLDPLNVYPASHIDPFTADNRVIAMAFPGIAPWEIGRTLQGMRFYVNSPICKNKSKEERIRTVLRVFRCEKDMAGHIMSARANENCADSNRRLTGLYDQAIPEAVSLLGNLYRACVGDEVLSERFNRNYSA